MFQYPHADIPMGNNIRHLFHWASWAGTQVTASMICPNPFLTHLLYLNSIRDFPLVMIKTASIYEMRNYADILTPTSEQAAS